MKNQKHAIISKIFEKIKIDLNSEFPRDSFKPGLYIPNYLFLFHPLLSQRSTCREAPFELHDCRGDIRPVISTPASAKFGNLLRFTAD